MTITFTACAVVVRTATHIITVQADGSVEIEPCCTACGSYVGSRASSNRWP